MTLFRSPSFSRLGWRRLSLAKGNKPLFVLALGLAALNLSHNAAAASTTLQLDLLVIKQPSWVRRNDTSPWPMRAQDAIDSAIDPLQIQPGSGMSWLPDLQAGLAAQSEKLEQQGYKTLYQASFRFPQQRLRNAPTFQIHQGDAITVEAENPYVNEGALDTTWFDRQNSLEPVTLTPINGWIRSWVDTYLFVEFDIAQFLADIERRTQLESDASDSWQNNRSYTDNSFNYGQSQAEQQATWSTEEFSQANWSTADIWPREAVQMFRIAERKRVRLNEIHYFDHPQIAILIRVTEPPSLNAAETLP